MQVVWILPFIALSIFAVSITMNPVAFADDTVTEVTTAQGASVVGCDATNTCFMPHTVTINVGDTVKWPNNDTTIHTAVSGVLTEGGPDGRFHSGEIRSNQSFSYTFEEAGEYPYYCVLHTWMSGLVIVQEAAGDGEEIEPHTENEDTVMPADESLQAQIDELTAKIEELKAQMQEADDSIQYDDDRFVTIWQTQSPGESITIPVGGATGQYTVDWGDGSITTHAEDATHVYGTPGNHTVQIYGNFTRIHLGEDHISASKILSIEQWGTTKWATMESAFKGAVRMGYNAEDAPDLSEVTDTSSMFSSALAFNGDISSWDVSSVTDMASMFRFAVVFNQPLNSWDVSSVTDMNNMFTGAASFNQPLDSWDVSSVKDMSFMFFRATFFNGDVSTWDTSSVTDMAYTFTYASTFNQPLDSWDVSSVKDMLYMFS